jgi:hypothetical protein
MLAKVGYQENPALLNSVPCLFDDEEDLAVHIHTVISGGPHGWNNCGKVGDLIRAQGAAWIGDD